MIMFLWIISSHQDNMPLALIAIVTVIIIVIDVIVDVAGCGIAILVAIACHLCWLCCLL